MQDAASDAEEDSAADQTTASEEGAESPVAGWRVELLASHRLDLRSSRLVDAESTPDVEELRGVAYIATAAHHADQSAESADGGDDDVVQLVDGTPAVLPDQTTLPSVAVHSSTKHVRDLLDTPTTLAPGTARQNHESLDSDRTSTHP